jgi:small subunit ribosomal protein S21
MLGVSSRRRDVEGRNGLGFPPEFHHLANMECRAVQVFVRDNNVEQALRILKKKVQREGVFKEMRRARFYEKPSVRAAREKADAIRRARKLARKQAIREGLIAPPVRKPIAPDKGTRAPRSNAPVTRQG